MDQEFVQFATDLVAFYDDPNYFANNATPIYIPGYWEAENVCRISYSYDWLSQGEYEWDWDCDVEFEWVPGQTTITYPGMSDVAASVWELGVEAESGQGIWLSALNMFTWELGVNMQTVPWCIDVFGEYDGSSCPSAALAAAIIALSDMIEDLFAPSARQPGLIYVTGHHIDLWEDGPSVLPTHTAIEYNAIGPVGAIVISAVASDPPGGFLTAHLGWETDKPRFNRTITTVSSSTPGESAGVYFSKLLTGNANYQNCLIYQAAPVWPGPGYNSNGYVVGLIDATGGVTEDPLNFVGSGVPVPAQWFDLVPPPCP
jgi:hypothetical protein